MIPSMRRKRNIILEDRNYRRLSVAPILTPAGFSCCCDELWQEKIIRKAERTAHGF